MFKKVGLLLCLLTFIAPAKRALAQQKVVIDKVVAVVGNSIVLYSEVEEVAQQIVEYRRERNYTSDRDIKVEALEQLMEQKLLYNQALIDSLEISHSQIANMADEQVGVMVAEAGGVAQLEEKFHRPIYDIKREIGYRFEERQYAQQMKREVESKSSITPGEVERFYKEINKDSLPMIPIQYVYSQITKYPISTKNAKLRAREQLLSLRERIVSGTRFDILARMYSEDGSAVRGGEMDALPVEQFEQSFGAALEKLQPGQVSGIVETIYGFHIIQLIEKKGNLYRARHILVRPMFTAEDMMETDRFLDSLVLKINEGEITFEVAAQTYSDDKYSRLNGGLTSNLELLEVNYNMDATLATTKHYKENLPVADFRALDGLGIGEISRAFQCEDYKGNKMSKIVRLNEILPSHPATLKEDYLELEDMALRSKRDDMYKTWLDKKIVSMFIRISPEFILEEEFVNKSWLK